jgi:hypothetical protein
LPERVGILMVGGACSFCRVAVMEVAMEKPSH